MLGETLGPKGPETLGQTLGQAHFSLGGRAGSHALIWFTAATVGWEIPDLEEVGLRPLDPLSAHGPTVDGSAMAYGTGN